MMTLKLSKLLDELCPSTAAKPQPKPESERPHEFMRELDRYGIIYSLSDITCIPRVELHGSDAEGLKKCSAFLASNPEIEAWIILHEATKNDILLEGIIERASIQHECGLSDSLYQTVLRRVKDVKEYIERDAEGRAIPKPTTDWDAELEKYR